MIDMGNDGDVSQIHVRVFSCEAARRALYRPAAAKQAIIPPNHQLGATLRIVRVHGLGGPEQLVIDDIDLPHPGPGEMRLRVLACGVNFADALLISGRYQAKPALPFGPGSEVCGVVDCLGDGAHDFAIGDRVLALTGGNGFAEYAVVRQSVAQAIPSSMSDEVAAGFPIAYGTSHVALTHKAQLQPGEDLVVHGASGGVGLTAVEIGKALGARVIATASTSEKLDIAKAHGADELINSSDEDLRVRIKELTDERGANVIYDPVGGGVFKASLRAIDFEGRIVVIGFASGSIPQIPANIVMVKNVDILGLNWPNYQLYRSDVLQRSFAQLFSWFEAGTIHPLVSEVFSLENTAQAIQHVMDRKAKGKVVVRL